MCSCLFILLSRYAQINKLHCTIYIQNYVFSAVCNPLTQLRTSYLGQMCEVMKTTMEMRHMIEINLMKRYMINKTFQSFIF